MERHRLGRSRYWGQIKAILWWEVPQCPTAEVPGVDVVLPHSCTVSWSSWDTFVFCQWICYLLKSSQSWFFLLITKNTTEIASWNKAKWIEVAKADKMQTISSQWFMNKIIEKTCSIIILVLFHWFLNLYILISIDSVSIILPFGSVFPLCFIFLLPWNCKTTEKEPHDLRLGYGRWQT